MPVPLNVSGSLAVLKYVPDVSFPLWNWRGRRLGFLIFAIKRKMTLHQSVNVLQRHPALAWKVCPQAVPNRGKARHIHDPQLKVDTDLTSNMRRPSLLPRYCPSTDAEAARNSRRKPFGSNEVHPFSSDPAPAPDPHTHSAGTARPCTPPGSSPRTPAAAFASCRGRRRSPAAGTP